MKIQKLESSLKYSSLELEKISSENQDLENRIESKNDEIKKLANQVRDLRGEHSSLQDKCTTSEQENQFLRQSLHSCQYSLQQSTGELASLKNRLFYLQTMVDEKEMVIQHREESLQKTSTARTNWSAELHVKSQRIEQLEQEVNHLNNLLHDERMTV